jgi:hypothetical protein
VAALQMWCAKLGRWMVLSDEGHHEGYAKNNHGLYFDQTVMALSTYAKDDDLVDQTRTRLHYRLANPYPKGHFQLDGSSPHELARPTALHYL